MNAVIIGNGVPETEGGAGVDAWPRLAEEIRHHAFGGTQFTGVPAGAAPSRRARAPGRSAKRAHQRLTNAD